MRVSATHMLHGIMALFMALAGLVVLSLFSSKTASFVATISGVHVTYAETVADSSSDANGDDSDGGPGCADGDCDGGGDN